MIKKLLFIAFISLTIAGVSQNELILQFDHQVGAELFEINRTYTEPEQGYNFNIQRLEYYISDISITHDGNQETYLTDTWVLVDAGGARDYSLGSHNITEVEKITFSIGVDPEHNHLDPTLFPLGHPLAPQNPSMHWGWSAGYRFAALEGKAGMNLLFTYEIHALGDENYFTTSLETASFNENAKIIIPVRADYLNLYKNIDVSFGLIEHGATGDAITLLQNFPEHVFSQIAFTGTNELANIGNIAVYPNPVTDGFCTVNYNLDYSGHTELFVTDVAGRQIQTIKPIPGQTSMRIALPANGVYFLHLMQNGKTLETEKIVVSQ